HSDSLPNLTALPVAFDMPMGVLLSYHMNCFGRGVTLMKGFFSLSYSNQIFGFFNSISGYYILKDGVTVLTQLTLGTNNETFV
ncbi:unnamed protein product, partial [Musa banksii]